MKRLKTIEFCLYRFILIAYNGVNVFIHTPSSFHWNSIYFLC